MAVMSPVDALDRDLSTKEKLDVVCLESSWELLLKHVFSAAPAGPGVIWAVPSVDTSAEGAISGIAKDAVDSI